MRVSVTVFKTCRTRFVGNAWGPIGVNTAESGMVPVTRPRQYRGGLLCLKCNLSLNVAACLHLHKSFSELSRLRLIIYSVVALDAGHG